MWAHLHSCASLVGGTSSLVCFSTLLFRLSFAHLLITLCICFNIPHPTIPHLSHCHCGHTIHWWFGYPLGTFPIWEWLHYSPWYDFKYRCNHYVGEWSSRTKRRFPPFPPPYTKTNGYCYHQRWFSNLDDMGFFSNSSSRCIGEDPQQML
jgi:hypothetical protein